MDGKRHATDDSGSCGGAQAHAHTRGVFVQITLIRYRQALVDVELHVRLDLVRWVRVLYMSKSLLLGIASRLMVLIADLGIVWRRTFGNSGVCGQEESVAARFSRC